MKLWKSRLFSHQIEDGEREQEIVEDPVHFLPGEEHQTEAVPQESEAPHHEDEDALDEPAEPVGGQVAHVDVFSGGVVG